MHDELLLNNRHTHLGMFGNESSEAEQPSLAKSMISTPFNPVHITHVGYNDQGEFTVRCLGCCVACVFSSFLYHLLQSIGTSGPMEPND